MKVKKIHLEISSQCQAACPACSRVYDYNPHLSGTLSPESWDFLSLKDTFSRELLGDLEELQLCGNYGDPLACGELPDFLEYLQKEKPSIKFTLHTNGGLGSKQTWERLGKVFSHGESKFFFSIDGLKDTNHIYRRNVNWKNIEKNVKTFISFGGRAHWKYLKFPHNEHQIEEAEDLAKDWGFSSFEVRTPYNGFVDFVGFPRDTELDPETQKSFKHLTESELSELLSDKSEFSCQAKNESSIYIDSHKRVWPCCWLSQDGDLRTRKESREDFFRKTFDQGMKQNFNSLKMHSLEDVLNSTLFQALEQFSFPTCHKTCALKDRR